MHVKMIGIVSVNGHLRSVLLLAMLATMSVQATSETMVGNMPAGQLDAFLSGLDTQCSESPQFEAFSRALRL